MGSPTILRFRKGGNGRRSEFQDGPGGFLLAKPGEPYFVGVDGDAGTEAEIGGGDSGDHEPEVVVEVIVLAAEAELSANEGGDGFGLELKTKQLKLIIRSWHALI